MRRHGWKGWCGVACGLLAAGLGSADASPGGMPGRAGQAAAYVGAVDFPGPGQGWEAFGELRRKLDRDFDQICGDTFCEGDYSDYRPLRLECSVASDNGRIGRCVWTFAASEISVAGDSGRLLVDNRTWRCPLELPAGLTLPALLQALAVESPLFQPLPGGKPIYESLIGCL